MALHAAQTVLGFFASIEPVYGNVKKNKTIRKLAMV